MLLCVWCWSGIKKDCTLLPKTYLMGFMSGLLGFATAFTNFSAIWILHTNEMIQKMLSKSWGAPKPGGAVLPLVEVFISHVSAVQHQCVHDVNCIDPTLRLALRDECIHITMSSKTKLKCNSSGFRMEPCSEEQDCSFNLALLSSPRPSALEQSPHLKVYLWEAPA